MTTSSSTLTPPALAPSRRAELARAFENAIRELRIRACIEFAEASGDEAQADQLREQLEALCAPARRWRF